MRTRAFSRGDRHVRPWLLDHGATIDAIDEEYRSTPLGVAARSGRGGIVSLLLERGADRERAGAPWATPVSWAKKKGHAEIERLVLTKHRTQSHDVST